MSIQSIHTDTRILALLVATCGGILSAQTVLPNVGEGGTVSLRNSTRVVDDTIAQNSLIDSLNLHLLEIDIKQQEQKVSETGFWRRIIPRVNFAASFGAHDLVFIDPASFTPYILPRDAYRLTVSLPLNDVLMSPGHTQATLELEKLRVMLSLRTMQYARARKTLEQQLTAIQDDLESLEKEGAIIQDLSRFDQLRFEQGKIEYDALARTRMEVLAIQRSIHRLQLQQSEIRLKMYGQ